MYLMNCALYFHWEKDVASLRDLYLKMAAIPRFRIISCMITESSNDWCWDWAWCLPWPKFYFWGHHDCDCCFMIMFLRAIVSNLHFSKKARFRSLALCFKIDSIIWRALFLSIVFSFVLKGLSCFSFTVDWLLFDGLRVPPVDLFRIRDARGKVLEPSRKSIVSDYIEFCKESSSRGEFFGISKMPCVGANFLAFGSIILANWGSTSKFIESSGLSSST